jgi:uncharacterized membrane protein YsdA (DUF1294 family)
MPRRTRHAKTRTSRSARAMPAFGLLAAAAGIALYLLLAQYIKGYHPYVVWLAAWSIVGFAFYGIDKASARGGGWRVPEVVLHALAFVGGVAGCWLGMFFFRHKTQHVEFKLALIVATIVHGALALSVLGPGV